MFFVVSKGKAYTEHVIVDSPEDAFSSDPLKDVLRGMLMAIQSLGWERIDVLFENALAHEYIVAKRSDDIPVSDSGIDVAHHVADTFLVD
ncbi:unnamed protein product [Aphanomyces euteiches]